ncbi:lysoplasmalogenase [Naumannella halotolerans]|uniref:lysoplasmalogenase n=1 Tax=Naumannella halotolerans TaxID=993414 RepID=UPI00370D55C4
MNTRQAWLGFGIAAVLHLTFQLLAAPTASALSQVFLAPMLIAAVLSSRLPSSPLRNWMLAALVFSFVGDMLPKFLPAWTEIYIMITGFAVAQICWIIGLWPLRSRSLVIRRRWQLPIYLITGMALLAACIPTAGRFTPAVIAYAVMLIAMALLASGLGWIGQLGGIAFMISDALIAFDRFVPWFELPQVGFAIMATYIAALGLLVAATVRHLRPPTRSPSVRPVESRQATNDTGVSGA